MLLVMVRNDGTGNREIGNYDVLVSVNGEVVAEERIEGYRRADGWRALVGMLANEGKASRDDQVVAPT